MKTLLIISTAIIASLLSVWMFMQLPAKQVGGTGGIGANSCTASTSVVAIGNGQGVKILASYARRAWAHVERSRKGNTDVATNTIAVFFGSWTHNTDTINTGYLVSTTTDPLIVGINTDFPVTSDLYALTNLGTTTVMVTECRY